MQSKQLLQKAHLIYQLEDGYIKSQVAGNPAHARASQTLERLERRLARGRDPQALQALAETRELLLEMTRESSFKLGYLMAHLYPLDDAFELWPPN